MATKTTYQSTIPGEGTDQQQRVIDALNPGLLNLHDFSVADLMKFAWNFAEKVNYFNTENQIDENWQDFFIEESEIKAFLNNLESNKSLTPHLTLFVCFLKLLDLSKKHFNQLTQRHLDFYFQKILKIEKRQPVPDQVHIIFELAKNIVQEKIDENTALDAGKDKSGNKLIFRTQEELIANKTSIAQLKNVYHHSANNLKAIKACEVANSFDGLGKANPTGDLKWFPFGYIRPKYSDIQPELPDAKLGFALASPVLHLKEGSRTITVQMSFRDNFSGSLADSAEQAIQVFLSGEKKWLGPFGLKASVQNKDLTFEIELDKKADSVVGYNSAVLGERFTTADPVMRFLIDTGTVEGYSFATVFASNNMKSATLIVDVKEMSGIDIENDLGALNAKKPFMPFGPIPVKGSNFTVRNEEMFSKNWTSFNLDVNWMNTPDSFRNQYFAYREDFRSETTSKRYKERILIDAKDPSGFKQNSANLIVKNDSYSKVSVNVYSANEWILADEAKQEEALFVAEVDSYKSHFTVANSNQKFDTGENSGLRLTLKNTFLHEMYPRIYAMAMMDETKTALIPKEPYTPLVESFTVGYTAETTATFDTKESYSTNQISLFHEHPFGQSQEHAVLKPKPLFATTPVVTLVPDYQPGGELYLSLKDAEPLQQISLLFQIFEGSENPEAISFASEEKMEWSVLCTNNWKTLNSNYLIANNTDNFLKSGIVKFSIPTEATNENTLLASGLFWIRVRMNKTYDAVCKIIEIKAQAVLTQFADRNNELSHLTTGLPAQTISKLSERKQSVKTVSQPFNSFGGSPVETDLAYYQRISERLRHKNRAITLWDYEHLILQQFPEIHKVRCLNHTSDTSFLAPGHVTLIVIPDILNKNVFDIYQPRVSRATLNKVQNYINQLNSLHVNAVVINPEYEEVEISLKVKFQPGYDENYYQKVLQEDLTKLLSPWAFEKSLDLGFGTTLHKSVIINYIEKLKYVDFITDLKIKHKDEYKASVSPSNPKAIIVSAKEHPIELAKAECTK
jgi:hypothetical protein